MIVVSDIFGKTPALEKLCRTIGDDVDIIDPYAGKYMGFQNEKQAYEFFMDNVSLNAYCELLQGRLEKMQSPVTLTGFSVDEFAGHLSDKKNVVLHKAPYLHGFMNELSMNYSRTGYAEYLDRLREHAI